MGVIAAHLGLTPETLVIEDLRRFKETAEGRGTEGAGLESRDEERAITKN
jgi:uncharacterized membrane protein